MNAVGSDARQLTTAEGLWTETDFRWSPDGRWIAFDRWQLLVRGMDWEVQPLGLVSADGGEVRSIGPTPVADGAAFEWSPDSTTIISLAGTTLAWPPSETMPDARPVLIEIPGGGYRDATWSSNSWPAWQRLALEAEKP
jgi:hypothetical protein